MKEQTGEVMSGRVGVEQLVVDRMRNPRQRMPVSLFGGRECPSEGFSTQSGMHMRVVDHVAIIIVVHKGMLVHTVIDRQSGHHEQEADNYVSFLWGGEKSVGRLGFAGRQHGDLTTAEKGGVEGSELRHPVDHSCKPRSGFDAVVLIFNAQDG